VLRHKPEKIGLELDREGWVPVDELIAAMNRAGVSLDETLLERIVREDEKERYAFSEDGSRIRTNYGHSVPVELGMEPTTPPELLYHGTATRFLASIEAEGLKPGNRLHVHLSPDRRTAVTVGRRHGKPVVLEIETLRMHEDGFRFFLSGSGIWLTSEVPPQYIRFP
jgi:putative RNA 2'-phosphotransferase